MIENIPYGRQNISEEDIEATVEVLRSNFLTQGPVVPEFERIVSSYCSAKYAVATNSATAALHLACLALGLGEGDLFWTSAITFVATANCGLYCGAKVDFVDIDPLSQNMSVSALEAKLIQASSEGKLPKIVIPVHFAGESCDMAAIRVLANRYKFKIIEDASHAIGGKYLNKPIGGCEYSDITIFSFHPVKIITTGEGGMALTNQFELMEKMILLRSHGITRDALKMVRQNDGPWYYEQHALGYNYRLTDIQAALGISQMKRLDEFVAKRHELASIYNQKLSNSPLRMPAHNADAYSSFHLYVMQVDFDENSWKYRNELFKVMRANEIGVNLHYIPVYRQPYYQKFGFNPSAFPISERYYNSALTLPLYPTLTEDQQNKVINTIVKTLDSFIN